MSELIEVTGALPAPWGMESAVVAGGAAGVGQPSWNAQRASPMAFHRYAREGSRLSQELTDRTWPGREIKKAPLWASVDLRDGNQSLANPMDSRRKGMMFDLLVRTGFKEIEVGYPGASAAEFEFVRELIEHDRIPDDVTIVVFTPARPDMIDRTFEAIRGAKRAVVHLCLATACLWRDVVFSMSPQELRDFTLRGAEHVAAWAASMRAANLRFEFSPETFNVTEPEFALDLSNAVASVWEASPDRPVTLNLPTTVETDSPNVFADQVEWMHRNLDNRGSIILSVHPHNDRGTAVASAELAVMAGADRIEGTLFGNGERTGNACLATLALNLFSRGVDPQLDFSDIDAVRRTVEESNQMPVPARHPYVGDLVYTAFSGTHQDAIGKGLAALEQRATRTGRPVAELPWEVPYLPIDPKDVGRTYESVVRVNSQSGKGGVAQVLKTHYGLDLPRELRVEFAKAVQRITDESGVEVTSRRLWEIFSDTYVEPRPGLLLKEVRATREENVSRLSVRLVEPDGNEQVVTGSGECLTDALVDALSGTSHQVRLHAVTQHEVDDAVGPRTAVYLRTGSGPGTAYGVGIDADPAVATTTAFFNSINRARSAS
ncbi:2-isopropylmalate synthase [Streptomyces sp. NBC_00122]|uniref:2-isopropylmalate synthase n=1 Tax=Streptomyces sp. NBC_00122 TaxID=2903623 RepID=UPI003868FBFD